jgi:hypothetical protein
MSLLLYIGLAAFFVAIIVSRILSERAVQLLTPEEKLRLLDSFSRFRALSSIPLVLVVFIFFSISSFPPQFVLPGFFGAWALLAGCIAWQHLFVHRRLRELSISRSYIAAFTRAEWITRSGFVALFVFSTMNIFQ